MDRTRGADGPPGAVFLAGSTSPKNLLARALRAALSQPVDAVRVGVGPRTGRLVGGIVRGGVLLQKPGRVGGSLAGDGAPVVSMAVDRAQGSRRTRE